MKRSLILAGAVAAIGLVAVAVVARSPRENRPWKTTDVWYHESDVALPSSGRPQLVEFFHPD